MTNAPTQLCVYLHTGTMQPALKCPVAALEQAQAQLQADGRASKIRCLVLLAGEQTVATLPAEDWPHLRFDRWGGFLFRLPSLTQMIDDLRFIRQEPICVKTFPNHWHTIDLILEWLQPQSWAEGDAIAMEARENLWTTYAQARCFYEQQYHLRGPSQYRVSSTSRGSTV